MPTQNEQVIPDSRLISELVRSLDDAERVLRSVPDGQGPGFNAVELELETDTAHRS